MKFTALGGGNRIGGSQYAYQVPGHPAVVVDCGAIQDEGRIVRYPQTFEGDCGAFLLSHYHFDHSGKAPAFVAAHPEAEIYMTEATRDGTALLAYDSLKIFSLEKEKAMLTGKPAPKPPPFNEHNIKALMEKTRLIGNTEWFAPVPRFKVSARSAGHIRGAAMFCIVLPDGRRVLHACDVSLDNQALVKGAKVPRDFLNPDVMVVECTYGGREIPDRAPEETRLIAKVREVFARRGRVLIPHFGSTAHHIAFPVARAGLRTYLDGMTRNCAIMYRAIAPWCENDLPFRFSDMPALSFVGSSTDSRYAGYEAEYHENFFVNRRDLRWSKESFVVVSTNGMLEGGPVLTWLKAFLEDERNAIIIPGYQAPGTSGRLFLEKLERGWSFDITDEWVAPDRITGENKLVSVTKTLRVLAEVLPFKLSGHSDGKSMANWIGAIGPKKVITIHGDPEAHEGMREDIKRVNPAIDVISAHNGEAIEFHP